MPVPYIIITQKGPPGSSKEGKNISRATTVTNRKIGTDEVAKRIEQISTVSAPDVFAVLYGLREIMSLELPSGNSVDLEGLGTFRVASDTGELENPEKVKPAYFRRPHIHFRPCKTFREMLRNLTFIRKR